MADAMNYEGLPTEDIQSKTADVGLQQEKDRTVTWSRGKFGIIVSIFQIVFIILFIVCVEYDEEADPKNMETDKSLFGNYYPLFQDVHVMIFFGIGFLLTFLRRHGFGSVGFNFFIGAFIIQWGTLMEGFLWMENGKIHVGVVQMLSGDFAAATVIISFCTVLGRISPIQLIVMGLLEIVFYTVNLYIGLEYLKVADIGGSMFIHTFAAYFGMSVSRILYDRKSIDNRKEGSNYHSDLFAMAGTLFLWLFWPSFNGSLAQGDERYRAILNTYYSLAACCVGVYVISHFISKEGKFNMVHVQNASLAGGVAVGASADLMLHPWGAILVGSLAGILSTIGYVYITPFLARKAKIHDTCGVHNLHGMPGVFAAIVAAIIASIAQEDVYGVSLYELFPARVPGNNTDSYFELKESFPDIVPGDGRSAGIQAGYQILALVVTVVVAIAGGLLTGLILKIKFWTVPTDDELFEDSPYWEGRDIENRQNMSNSHEHAEDQL